MPTREKYGTFGCGIRNNGVGKLVRRLIGWSITRVRTALPHPGDHDGVQALPNIGTEVPDKMGEPAGGRRRLGHPDVEKVWDIWGGLDQP